MMNRRWIIIGVIIGLGLIFQSPSNCEETTLNEPKEKASSKDIAEELYSRSLELDRQGKTADAIEVLDQAIRMNSNQTYFYLRRAYQLRSMADYAKALNDLTKCIELSGEGDELKYECSLMRVDTLCEMGDSKQGLDLIDKYYNTERNIIKYMGDIFYVDWVKPQKYNESMGVYAGGRYYPLDEIKRVHYKNQTGYYHANTGKFIPVVPATPNALSWEAEQSVGIDDRFIIVQDVLARKSINDSAVLHYLEGGCYQVAKQYDKAINEFTQALSESKGNEHIAKEILTARAQIYSIKKQSKKVIDDLSQVLSLHCNDIEREKAIKTRARLYHEDKQFSKALEDYGALCDICKKRSGCEEHACLVAFNLRRDINRDDKWTYLGFTDNERYYYDKTTVTRKSDHSIKVWMRVEKEFELNKYKSFGHDNDKSFELQLLYVDCANREIGVGAALEYGSDGNLAKSEEYNANETRTAIAPGSIGNVVYKRVCKSQQKEGTKKKTKKGDRDT